MSSRFTVRTQEDGLLSFFLSGSKGGYVFLESPGKPGTLGTQICEGGGFTGACLTANEETLAKTCRRWRRQYLARFKNNEFN